MNQARQQIRRYLAWMKAGNYAERTCETRQAYLEDFATWCDERGLESLREITEEQLESYRRHVSRLKRRDGKPLSSRTQRNRLVPLKSFFRWLRKTRAIGSNPMADFDMPRQEKRLPRAILSEDETQALLETADPRSVKGLRDRAILELLYSTGLRRAEVAALEISDVDAQRGLVSVRRGKGLKDRMSPIAESTLEWVARYLEESRPKLLVEDSPARVLFLNDHGHAWQLKYLSTLVKHAVLKAGVGKSGGCHLLRHACATHMLENGADIRHVQEQLGHASLQTTQVYAQVSLVKLKQAHAKSHPTARNQDLKT